MEQNVTVRDVGVVKGNDVLVNDAIETLNKTYEVYEYYDREKLKLLNKVKDKSDILKMLKINETKDYILSNNDLEWALKLLNIEDTDSYLDYGWDIFYNILGYISAKKKYKISDLEQYYGCLKEPDNLEAFKVDTKLKNAGIVNKTDGKPIAINFIKSVVSEGLKAADLNKRAISILKKSGNKTKSLLHIQNKIDIDKIVTGKIKINKNDVQIFCKFADFLDELTSDLDRLEEFVDEMPVDYLEDIFKFIDKYNVKLIEKCDKTKLDYFAEQVKNHINR